MNRQALSFEEKHWKYADKEEHLRAAGQGLRFPGYPQQAPQARNTLGASRLQNTTKLGNGASWGFGAPANGVQGLANPQARQSASTSFAQTIGGSQPATPLDMSEFPSLSGTSQPQYQNPSQAIWQRAVQQTPVQRPQQHSSNAPMPQQQQPSQQRQEYSSPNHEELFPGSHMHTSLDDYRQAQNQTVNSRQPQTTSIDDFPPLGRNGMDENDTEQRGNIMPGGAYGGFSSPNAFSQQQGQPRHTLSNAPGTQADSTRSSSVVERTMSPGSYGVPSNSRSPTEINRPNQGPQNNDHSINSLLANFSDPRSSQQQTNQAQQSAYDGRMNDQSADQTIQSADLIPISQMTLSDRYGVAGFVATIRSDDPVTQSLVKGQDLNLLGLNLTSPEPLYPTWGGPFADAGSRPLQPDFHLPDCYTVDNVHRVRDKIQGFSDETLFWIFYTQPKDILQELAATELTQRNWRFHKIVEMWLTKDPSLEPRRITDEAEQGSYVFFDHRTWEKVRQTDFILEYASLAPATGRLNGQ